MAPPRTRTYSSKVRTGCLICKQRHVKCDEAKPSCNRCKRGGRAAKCQYGTAIFRANSLAPAREILPRDDDSFASLTLERPSSVKLDPHEAMSFDFYRATLAKAIPSHEFWDRSITRDSMRDECVRYAMVALGSLARVSGRNVNVHLWRQLKLSGTSGVELDSDHMQAVKYHSRAVSMFNARLLGGKPVDPRSTIILTAMFGLFEFMHGNTVALEGLLSSAILSIKDKLVTFRRNASSASLIAASIDDEGVRDGEFFIQRMTLHILLANPNPNSPTLRWLSAALENLNLVSEIPGLGADTNEVIRIWNIFFTKISLWIFRSNPRVEGDQFTDLEKYRDEQAYILAQLDLWAALLSRRLAGTADLKSLLVVQAECLNLQLVRICVMCLLDPTEMMYDDYAPEFQTVVSGAEAIARAERPRTPEDYLIETKLEVMMMYVSERCRDRTIRERALSLFHTLNMTMADWVIRACYLGRYGLSVIEEEGRDETGVIPAEARYRWTHSEWDELHTRMTITFIALVPGPDGKRDMQQRTLYLSDFGFD